jgi:3-methyladenine DNA glycosylase AlkD
MLRKHPTAFTHIDWKVLEPLGDLMDSWGAVDLFAYLAGPAWRADQLSDDQVLKWTQSENRWWRRAALVCTVFLNRKAPGGTGDTKRTLAVCERLVNDRDKMVVKALSWALRDLVKVDPKAAENFLNKYDTRLPSLVKREVRNKLITGVKNPRRKKDHT